MSKHRVPDSRADHRLARRRIGRSWIARIAAVSLAAGFTIALGMNTAQALVTTTVHDYATLATDLSDNFTDVVVLDHTMTFQNPNATSNLTVSTTHAKTLDLNGTSLTVTGITLNAPIDVAGAADLTITSSLTGGSLTAAPDSTNPSAGIGGGFTQTAGTITIEAGTITATGSTGGAGIGSGEDSATGGSVTVSGGTVSATGSTGGAGIGGGDSAGNVGFGGGGSTSFTGGSVTAQGGSGGAGVGGGNGGAGGTATASPSATLVATGGNFAAGIGGGSNGAGGTFLLSGTATSCTPTILMPCPSITAAGGVFGAGVGGGNSGDGATVTVDSGSLTAVGGAEGAGIGGGATGSGGSLDIESGAGVSATSGGDGHSSAVGAGDGGTSFGSFTNNGGLLIPPTSTLRLLGGTTVTNAGSIVVQGGGGIATEPSTTSATLVNNGSIVNQGTIQNDGNGNLLVSVHNYTLVYNAEAGSGAPASQHVYAKTMAAVGLSLGSATPPAGATFTGWFFGPLATDLKLSIATDLSTFGDGPRSITFDAHYRSPQTITFNPLPNVTLGVAPFTVSATADSGLIVTFSAAPSSVCTMSGNTVTIIAAGSCAIRAQQAGDAFHFPATDVVQSFAVLQGTLTVQATGGAAYGAPPSFTPVVVLPSGVTLGGALSCTDALHPPFTSDQEINTFLHPGAYTIDSSTCGGIVLQGPNAMNYKLAFQNGLYTVTKAFVPVIASATQPYNGTPTFTPLVTLPPNVTMSGTLTCTGLKNPTASISPSLPVNSYSIDQNTCSGLSLSDSTDYAISYPTQNGSLLVTKAPVTVTAKGTQGYGGTPTFTGATGTLPANVTVTGTLTCTGLTGNIPISPSLGPGGVYATDPMTCSGLSLGGSNASNYKIAYASGTFTVTKAHVSVVTHTNTVSNANSVHKFIFTTTVTNTDAHTPVGGIAVTVSVKTSAIHTTTCTATTNSSGVATCSTGDGNMFLPPEARSFVVSTPATAVLQAGSGTGTVGS